MANNREALGDIVGAMIVSGLFLFSGWAFVSLVADYRIPATSWQCSQSRVVSEELPRKEECVQYTKKEVK